MHLLLTDVLPFLAHDHASAGAVLTCRSHNFHASIIPEFLSDEERVQSFCEARQQNQIKVDHRRQCANLYNLFVQTPLMQFSPSLVICQDDCVESILKPLLETQYFTRTLQRCVVAYGVHLTTDLFQALSKVQSLTNLDLGEVENEHLEIIINSFPSLETLTIYDSHRLASTAAFNICSPPPPATKTLRSLTMLNVDPSFATQLVPHFTNLRKLELRAEESYGAPFKPGLDLLPFSSSLSLLTDLFLDGFTLKNTESLKNLVHLQSIEFIPCWNPDLSFLTQENSLPELTTLRIDETGDGLSTSFAPLADAPNLQVLEVVSVSFDNDCLQYLESMVHLRTLDLSSCEIVGDSRSLKTVMQNLFQLEELDLRCCYEIGNQGAIAGALYSTHSRLRVLNLTDCGLVDDDLNGICALKNTLEVLYLGRNEKLTSKGLMHCKDLVKLKKLNLQLCHGINDLSPLQYCLNLEELNVLRCERLTADSLERCGVKKLKKLNLQSCNSIDDLSPLKDCLNLEDLKVSDCRGLTDGSFKIFSDEPNSFPNLRFLDMSECKTLTGKVFEHLSNNNNLMYQLKELNVKGMIVILTSSATARNNIYQLRGLRRFYGFPSSYNSESEKVMLHDELMRNLKNLDVIYSEKDKEKINYTLYF